jgi:hypothetical protein
MKKAGLFLIFTCLLLSDGRAVPTEEISSLRRQLSGSGSAVSDSNRDVINRFWRIAMDAMLLSEDSSQLVSIRRQIQEEKGTEPLSMYATAYIQSGRDHLRTAFETIAKWENTEKKTLMERNLIVLAAQLQSTLLSDLGLERLGHSDEVVRYWAVKAVAGSAVAQQLTNEVSGDEVLTDKILKALKERVATEPSMDILRTIVAFAAMVNRDEAREILLLSAQRRIQEYKDWKVDNEQFDALLLKAMGQIVLADRESEPRAMMARRFAELFSMIFQRYLAAPSPLTDDQRRALLNVIVEVDNQILTRIMGQQTPILRAIQRPAGGLEREYESIFGSEMGAGQLGTRLNFNYGKTADGRAINAPPKLPSPPQK